MTLRQIRIVKELTILQQSKLEGIIVNFDNSQLDTIIAKISGPEGSRFESTSNLIELKLTEA